MTDPNTNDTCLPAAAATNSDLEIFRPQLDTRADTSHGLPCSFSNSTPEKAGNKLSSLCVFLPQKNADQTINWAIQSYTNAEKPNWKQAASPMVHHLGKEGTEN